ncbi:MAG: prepilin peptidase [Terriglobia bacterium]|nr:MAG: prepilin peptidase [Terriglobia bacterium]
MSLTLPPPGVEVLLLILVLAAAVYDVRYRRIPNWISVGGALLGIAMNAFLYRGVPGLALSFKGLALGFGVYFLLYAVHAMGAGDVKLMGAVGALVGWQDWFGIFLITALVGGTMALLVTFLRGRLKTTVWNVGYILGEMRHGRAAYVTREELDVKSPKSVGLPHGAVIAVGTIFYLAISAHFVG